MGNKVGQGLVQARFGRGWGRIAHQFSGGRPFPHVPIAAFFAGDIWNTSTHFLVGAQKRVGKHEVHPGDEVGIGGGVGLLCTGFWRVGPGDSGVHFRDPTDFVCHGLGGAKGGDHDPADSTREPAEGVGVVAGVVVNACHGAGVQGLHHEGAHTGDEGGGVAVDVPDGAAWAEISGVGPVAHLCDPGRFTVWCARKHFEEVFAEPAEQSPVPPDALSCHGSSVTRRGWRCVTYPPGYKVGV